MDEVLNQLHARIGLLVQRCEQLEQENRHLSENTMTLLRDRETLRAKNQIAITQVEEIVSRLKSIENLSS